jgi:hypothetical protein
MSGVTALQTVMLLLLLLLMLGFHIRSIMSTSRTGTVLASSDPCAFSNSGCAWSRAKLCVSASYRNFPIKDDRRTYGDVTGVIWLEASCQPDGVFTQTWLL